MGYVPLNRRMMVTCGVSQLSGVMNVYGMDETPVRGGEGVQTGVQGVKCARVFGTLTPKYPGN